MHSSCVKCVHDREPKEPVKQPILGSRVMPSYIMFDGEGKYARKLNQNHNNHRVQIGYNWTTNTEGHQDVESITQSQVTSVERLPKIFNRRKVEDVIPMKPSVTSAHVQRFGKYSTRYLQKTDVFAIAGKPKDEFTPTSDKIGKFYLSEEPRQRFDINDLESHLSGIEYQQKEANTHIPQPKVTAIQELIIQIMNIRYFFTQQAAKIQPPVQIKRFYKTATVERANSTHPMHQWVVKLDGKTVKTPSRNLLEVPTPQLAASIAHEFNMQADFIRSTTMPLLTLARTAIEMDNDDRIRKFTETSLVNYLERDTLLFREDKESKLYKIQTAQLDPQVKKFSDQMQIRLHLNFGLDVKELDLADKLKIQKIVFGLGNWQLVSLDQKADNLKSFILAFQLWQNVIGVAEAVKLSRLEEQYQIDTFGLVEGHHDVDENTVLMNTAASQLFSQLITSQNINY